MVSSPATAPAVILAALGIWGAAVPYLADALGLRLDVSWSVEFVDHVIPGTIVALTGAVLAIVVSRGGEMTSGLGLASVGACFLAGVWMVSTHVPLLAHASDGRADWGAALLHNSPGVPIAVLSFWLLLAVLRDPGAGDTT